MYCSNIEIGASNIMRSGAFLSSHTLYKGDSYSLPSLSEESEDGPVRRVHSAGDLEGVSLVSTSKENSMIIEGMMKAIRYSPEEKRERIEKYRSKRNLRNFKRKIQYECRKTLADGRTRFKGRFVRNDEISTMIIMEDNISCDNLLSNDHSRGDEARQNEEKGWINLLDYDIT